jgi:hypothetical protein
LHQCLDPDPSCQQAVARLLAYRAARGLPDRSADAGAYCKARQRLPEGLLRALTRRTGRGIMDNTEGQYLLKGTWGSKRYMGGLLEETSHLARRALPLLYANVPLSETT